jgi:hypothetical protein
MDTGDVILVKDRYGKTKGVSMCLKVGSELRLVTVSPKGAVAVVPFGTGVSASSAFVQCMFAPWVTSSARRLVADQHDGPTER